MPKHRRRKSSRSTSYQIRWYENNSDRLVQVRGDKRKDSTLITLLGADWIDKSSIQVRRL